MNDRVQTAGAKPVSTGFFGKVLAKLSGKGPAIVPVVRLNGVIAAEQRSGRLNITAVEPLLKKAFAMKRAPVVAIVINSPGGSPVQSRLISKRIRQLADANDKKVLVFIEDVAASGGYFIAVAGDEIIADPSSIVGSIGVIYTGFGFDEAIKKIGVSRRIYTAGNNKSSLDPFMPEKPEDVERLKTYELDIHQVFIDHVKAARGAKLMGADDELFTGEWWPAVRGIKFGLVDKLGEMHTELRARFGDDVQLKTISAKRPLFRLPFLGMGGEAGLGSEVVAALDDKLLWSRFGL